MIFIFKFLIFDFLENVIKRLGSNAEVVLTLVVVFGLFYWFSLVRWGFRGFWNHFVRPRKDLKERYGY